MLPFPVCQRSDFFVKAPSDEGAVSEADWGREKAENMLFSWKYGRKPNIFSPSVAYGASSLIRGSLRCGMHQRFFDGLTGAAPRRPFCTGKRKLGFVVPLDAFDQLPTTVSLRGGFCRRGNLLVQSYEIIAVKIEVSANNVPYFERFHCPALYQEIATALRASQ